MSVQLEGIRKEFTYDSEEKPTPTHFFEKGKKIQVCESMSRVCLNFFFHSFYVMVILVSFTGRCLSSFFWTSTTFRINLDY